MVRTNFLLTQAVINSSDCGLKNQLQYIEIFTMVMSGGTYIFGSASAVTDFSLLSFISIRCKCTFVHFYFSNFFLVFNSSISKIFFFVHIVQFQLFQSFNTLSQEYVLYNVMTMVSNERAIYCDDCCCSANQRPFRLRFTWPI